MKSRSLTLIEKLVQAGASLSPQLLTAAPAGLRDQAWYVRQRALALMVKLVEADA